MKESSKGEGEKVADGERLLAQSSLGEARWSKEGAGLVGDRRKERLEQNCNISQALYSAVLGQDLKRACHANP